VDAAGALEAVPVAGADGAVIPAPWEAVPLGDVAGEALPDGEELAAGVPLPVGEAEGVCETAADGEPEVAGDAVVADADGADGADGAAVMAPASRKWRPGSGSL